MSRRNLAAPRSPIGSIIIPFYLHQVGWVWGNNSRPRKRYNLRSTVYSQERFPFEVRHTRTAVICPSYPPTRSATFFVLIADYPFYLFHLPLSTPCPLPQSVTFFFYLSPLRASIIFPFAYSTPSSRLVSSRLVASRRVSSRHVKTATSFFIFLRCTTIDRLHTRR